MSAQHTPGLYTVERHIRVGYRGGKRATGWNVVRASDKRLMQHHHYKSSAEDNAALLNSLEVPLTEAPALGADYWRLTESGHWLYCWSDSPEDQQALREGRAFAAIAKATGATP